MNWRSDAGLLRALDRLYGGAALGHDEIVVHPVTPSHQESPNPRRSAVAAAVSEPRRSRGARYRILPALAPVRRPYRRRSSPDDIVATLASGQEIVRRRQATDRCGPATSRCWSATATRATLVREALDRAGVPCVLTGGSSVFTTAAATAWQRMLAALEQPHRPDRVRLAALSPLLGVYRR